MDPVTFTLTREIGRRVAEALTSPATDPLERACVIVAGDIADDDCQCGQLAVTVPRIYGSRTPPLPAGDDADTAPCGMPYLVTDVLLRVVRCAPGPDDTGSPPSCEALETAALLQHRDMHAVRRAVGCCLQQMADDNRVVGYLVGVTESVGPTGGCVGSQLPVSYWLPWCTCPDGAC